MAHSLFLTKVVRQPYILHSVPCTL